MCGLAERLNSTHTTVEMYQDLLRSLTLFSNVADCCLNCGRHSVLRLGPSDSVHRGMLSVCEPRPSAAPSVCHVPVTVDRSSVSAAITDRRWFTTTTG